MKTIETYQKAEQNPLGICDQQSNVPQRHFYHLVVVRLLLKGLRREPEPRGMIRSKKSCEEVIMTFTLTRDPDFHARASQISTHYQPSLSLNQIPWAEKTFYPTSNPLSHLSTGFKCFSAVFPLGCAKSCFAMEMVAVNIWREQHFWADCLHSCEVMLLGWGLDLSNQARRVCTPWDAWKSLLWW